MIWQKLKTIDWQRVADWCGRFFWKYLAWVLITLPFAPFVLIVACKWLGLSETIHQAVSFFTLLLIILFGLAFIALGLIGIALSFLYMIQFKYQYSKAVQLQNFVVICSLIFLVCFGLSASKKRAIHVYRSQFIDTSRSIFEQLNANSASIQAADAQIKQLIEKYNSSNNTLKVTRIISHPAHIYSTTSDREGLSHPVVQFQLLKQSDGTLSWRCQVVRAGEIDRSRLQWCAHRSSYRSHDEK